MSAFEDILQAIVDGGDPATLLPPGSRGEVLLQAVLNKTRATDLAVSGKAAASDVTTLAGTISGHTTQLAEIAQPLSGAGAPTTATVGKVGQTYLDTTPTTGRLYVCSAVAGSVYTWVPQALKSVVDAKANAGSLALIETITLTEDVNTVTPANIGNNIYDELIIEYIGTASTDSPQLVVRNAANITLAQYPNITAMKATRYVRIRIARLISGAGALYFSFGNAGYMISPTPEACVLASGADSEGIAGFKLLLSSTYTFKADGVFKIWARKWAL